ncbi:MAG: hypothetical protein U9P80_05535 [Thermodesulfobacteriota bacterium]|nr:hypothetical protein [Thermodesulfobacteriota bacterium]
MRFLTGVLFFFMATSFAIQAAELDLEMPGGVSGVMLLSAGTPAILDHLHDVFDKKAKVLDDRFQIHKLKTKVQTTQAGLEEATRVWENGIHSIKTRYISQIEIQVHSFQVQVSPESSILGEFSFFCTIKNMSDRIIGEIAYRPVIGDILLPTSSDLVFELIDPRTLKFGLCPGHKISNEGFQPAQFSFFVGELTKDQLRYLEQDAHRQLTLDITGLSFLDKTGYKGQVSAMDAEKAFASDLAVLEKDIEAAQQAKTQADQVYADQKKAYEMEYNKVFHSFMDAASALQRASVRYTAKVDKDNHCHMDNVEKGQYMVYAHGSGGRVIFRKICIDGPKKDVSLSLLEKDPFKP